MGYKIIITAGPTNERIDSVMQITNMSTGSLGATIAETFAKAHEDGILDIDKIYYLSPKLAKKPERYRDGGIFKEIEITDANSLLQAIRQIAADSDGKVDAIIHSCAVGDYKARYSWTAEKLADSIMSIVASHGKSAMDSTSGIASMRQDILDEIKNPKSANDDSGKMSSYEPDLFTMMDLTPKVIRSLRGLFPDAVLVGFKLLDGVSREELVSVASRLREKNRMDWIIANDLSLIKDGKHPGLLIGEYGAEHKMNTKKEIAEQILASVVSKLGTSGK